MQVFNPISNSVSTQSKSESKGSLKSVIFPFLVIGIVFGLALFRAFSRGANDFAVFHYAWHLVWIGKGTQVFLESPDRFLYSPGFAWLLAPLGALPLRFAFLVWTGTKIFLLVWVARWFSESFLSNRQERLSGKSVWICAALGLALVARPLLIDFEYGQVNSFILSIVVWAMASHLNPKTSISLSFLSWFFCGWIAVAKIFPLPILLVPWLLPLGLSSQKLRAERLAILFALAFTVLAPLCSLGFAGTFQLFMDWRGALVAKGFPTESHNQSFLSLIYHYLSGQPTPVIALGRPIDLFGVRVLSQNQIFYLSLFWTFLTSGLGLAWMIRGPRQDQVSWLAMLISWLIVPSHLIWKPYFVMSLPVAVLLVYQATRSKSNLRGWFPYLVFFVAFNFTSFDFLGLLWGAWFEASSGLLVVHLALLFWVCQQTFFISSSRDFKS